MVKNVPLAKITPPVLPDIFLRERLFNTLDDARERQMLWVTGPPGAGKTTLVSSYLENRDISVLWYQIDQDDIDIATFFHYLGLACKKASTGRPRPLSHFTHEYLQNLPAFTRRFFKQLFAQMPSPFAIVFDNYQEIPSDSKIHEALRDCLGQLPQDGTIIAISRSDPPAALARTLANQSMTVVGWKDISLTSDESESIAKLLGAQQPLKEILTDLHDKAEGWVAGLVLILDSFNSGRLNQQALKDTSKTGLFDYFATEILEHTDHEVETFLLKTAFLVNMTIDMAITLTGNENAGSILPDLNRRHFFTEQKIETDAVYQYHSLFREFLIARAKDKFSDTELIDIQNRSASLLETSGQADLAPGLLINAGNWAALVRVVCQQAPLLLKQGRGQTLESWLKQIPKVISETNPWLIYWRGACRLPYNLTESRYYLKQSFDLFNQAQDIPGSLLSWSSMVDTYIYEWGNFSELDPWIEALDQLMERIAEFPSLEIEARVAASMFSALMYRQPQHPEFEVWENRVQHLLQSALDVHHQVVISNHLMLYYSWQGDLAKAAMVIETLKPVIRDKEIGPLTLIVWHSMEGMHHWLRLNNDSCLEAIERGLAIANDTGIHMWDFMLYAQGMYGAMNTGDIIKASELLDNMAASKNDARKLDAAHFHYQAASLALTQNNIPQAVEHAHKALAMAQEAASPFPITLLNLGLAQALFEQGDETQAQFHLDQTIDINQGLKSHYIEYHKLLIQAHFNLEKNRDSNVTELLTDAFALARQYGLFTMTWWRPNVMVRLCGLALKHNIEKDYIQQLIYRQNLLPDPDIAEEIENWPWRIKIFSLGRFSLLISGEPLRSSGRTQSKPLDLLKSLVAFGGREVSEHRFIEAMWPDADGDAAHQAFETTLHRLRKLINNDKAIILRDGKLKLDQRYCWVDTWVLERLLGKIDSLLEHGDTDAITDTAEKIMSLYQGPFLGTEEISWVMALRERLHSKFLRQLGVAGSYWESSGQQDTAIDFYRRILEIDPLAEEFYRKLITCYEKQGRTAEALTTYTRCKNVMNSMLNINPSPATKIVYEKVISEQ